MWVFFFLLYASFTPYENNNRKFLGTFELLTYIGVLLAVLMSMFSTQAGMDALDASDAEKELGFNIMTAFVLLFNVCLVVYSVFVMIVNRISLPVQYIMDAGSYVDNLTFVFHNFVRHIRGMNSVYYLPQAKDGSRSIDVSNLTPAELQFLAHSFSETVRACMKNGRILNTWYFGQALHEAYRRAVKGREAKLRFYYGQYGQRPWSLLTKLFPLFCNVTLRAPDIPADSRGQSNEGCGTEGSPITVDEFQDALSTVNLDILHDHPYFFKMKEHDIALAREDEQKLLSHDKKVVSAMNWGYSTPLKVFRADLESHGSYEPCQEEPVVPRAIDEEDFILQQNQLKEYRAESSVQSTQALEKELKKIKSEIKKYRQELNIARTDFHNMRSVDDEEKQTKALTDASL